MSVLQAEYWEYSSQRNGGKESTRRIWSQLSKFNFVKHAFHVLRLLMSLPLVKIWFWFRHWKSLAWMNIPPGAAFRMKEPKLSHSHTTHHLKFPKVKPQQLPEKMEGTKKGSLREMDPTSWERGRKGESVDRSENRSWNTTHLNFQLLRTSDSSRPFKDLKVFV